MSQTSDVAHEKAALSAYMATQFNTAYTAAPKPYESRAFSLPFFSNPRQGDPFSKTQGMYRSIASFPEAGSFHSSSTGNYSSLQSSGTSYTSGSSSSGYSSSSSGGGNS